MSRKCIVGQCGSVKRKNCPQTTTFHELPSNPERRNCWLNVISEWNGLRTVPAPNVIKQCMHVCGRHFSPDSFVPETTKLVRNAVPSIIFFVL